MNEPIFTATQTRTKDGEPLTQDDMAAACAKAHVADRMLTISRMPLPMSRRQRLVLMVICAAVFACSMFMSQASFPWRVHPMMHTFAWALAFTAMGQYFRLITKIEDDQRFYVEKIRR